MIQFEKYLDKELNFLSLLLFNLKLKLNKTFKNKFENYKKITTDLKYMFLINEAEKEINKDISLKNLEALTEKYIAIKKKDKNVINYLNNAF